jgi:hypothetical protein
MKNKAAVALGRRGGKARAAKLSPKRRKEIATNAALARWPGKRYTLKVACPQPGCKVTINHSHITKEV